MPKDFKPNMNSSIEQNYYQLPTNKVYDPQINNNFNNNYYDEDVFILIKLGLW